MDSVAVENVLGDDQRQERQRQGIGFDLWSLRHRHSQNFVDANFPRVYITVCYMGRIRKCESLASRLGADFIAGNMCESMLNLYCTVDGAVFSSLPGGGHGDKDLTDTHGSREFIYSCKQNVGQIRTLLTQIQSELLESGHENVTNRITDCSLSPMDTESQSKTVERSIEKIVDIDLESSPLMDIEEEEQQVLQEFWEDMAREEGYHRIVPVKAIKTRLQKMGNFFGQSGLAGLIEDAFTKESNFSSSMTADQFSKVMKDIPKVRGERLKWVSSLGLNKYLSKLLKRGSILDGLSGLKSLNDEDTEKHINEVCKTFFKIIPAVLRRGISKLRSSVVKAEGVQSIIVSSKFEMPTLGKFATLNDFYNGLEVFLGAPNPKVFEGIEKEHNFRQNSRVRFETSNSNIETWPQQEWEFVVCPRKNVAYPQPKSSNTRQESSETSGTTPRPDSESPPTPCAESLDCRDEGQGITKHHPVTFQAPGAAKPSNGSHRRKAETLKALLAKPEVQKKVSDASLCTEEVICLRLYSGPMFMLYNAALRGIPQSLMKQLSGNKYETTIFVITSGITKLAKVTGMPTDRKLYRGVSSEMILPDQFWRSFEECQVTLSIKASNRYEAPAVAKLLESRCVEVSYKFKQCSTPLTIKCLKPPEHLELGQEDVLEDGDLPPIIRVLELETIASKLNLVVSVQAPFLNFKRKSQVRLVEKVAECAQRSISDVEIVDVSFKPRDFKGGVELGFLSMTTRLQTAASYTYDKNIRGHGLVFEICAGRVDVGASIKFLSQFPDEDEYLMPPLSCLEVVGEPYVEGNAIIMPLRVNINLKAATVEALVRRRKDLQATMSRNLREDLLHSAKFNYDNLIRHLEDRENRVVEVIRGMDVVIPKDESNTVHFQSNHWAVVGAPFLQHCQGKVYYELEVLEASGLVSVGWAGTSFRGMDKVDIGDDDKSWGFYSFGKVRHGNHSKDIQVSGWLKAGAVISVAVDIDEGQMFVSVCFNGENTWHQAFNNVRPSSEVGSGIYPVFGGGWGSKVRYRFVGCGPAPGDGYVCVSNIVQPLRIELTYFTQELVSFRRNRAQRSERYSIEPTHLLETFDEVCVRHEVITAEEYNDDETYQKVLTEVMEAKVALENKQETLVMLVREGGNREHLSLANSFPAEYFCGGTSLEAEIPSYSWKLILSGWFRHLSHVSIPLGCPPGLIALVWHSVFDAKASVQTIDFGTTKRFGLDNLVPSLCLKDLGLHTSKFENAVLGFVIEAFSTPCVVQDSPRSFNSSPINTTCRMSKLDFQELEFSVVASSRLLRSVFDGCRKFDVNVNSLFVANEPAKPLRDCIMRGACDPNANKIRNAFVDSDAIEILQEGPSKFRNLGSSLDGIDWACILAQVERESWSSLNLSDSMLDWTAAMCLGMGLPSISSLTSLDLSVNYLGVTGAKFLGASVSQQNQLKRLLLGSNQFGPSGASEVANSLSTLTLLTILEIESNNIQAKGLLPICKALRNITSLTCLNVSDNDIDEIGGKNLSTLVQESTSLTSLNAGKQDLGQSTWGILMELMPRLQACQCSSSIFEGTAVNQAGKNILQLPGYQVLNVEGTRDLSRAFQERQLSCLTLLDLSANKILEPGATCISDCLSSLISLCCLRLAGNTIKDNGATALARNLKCLSHLKTLALQNNSIGKDGWNSLLDAFPERLTCLNDWDGFGDLVAGRLTALDTCAKEVGPALARHLAMSSSSLLTLNLSYVPPHCDRSVGQGRLQLLGEFTSLTSLTIENESSESSIADLCEALSTLTNLRILMLRNVCLDELGCAALISAFRLGQATGLQTLVVTGNQLDNAECLFFLGSLTALVGLKTLDISANNIGTAAATLTSTLCLPADLEHLDVSENLIGPDGVRAFEGLHASSPRLVHVNLGGNALQSHGVEVVLKSMLQLKRLAQLDLQENDMGPRPSAIITTRLASCSALTKIDLSGNKLGSEFGSLILASLQTLSHLECVDLADNDIGSGEDFAEYFDGFASLKILHLENNNLGPAAICSLVEKLSRCGALCGLYLRGNQLGADGAVKVSQVLPRCTGLEVHHAARTCRNTLVDAN